MQDDGKIDELEEKVKVIEQELESLISEQDSSPAIQSSTPVSIEFQSVDQTFIAHWVSIDEATSFSTCEDIESNEDAQKLFKEISESRPPGGNKREILHGDVMILLCNTAKKTEEGEDGGEEVTYPDACYYIGMCFVTNGVTQEVNNHDPAEKIGSSQTPGDTPIKQFISWSSCGGESCPEEPDAIQIDELAIPESLGGGSEQNISGIEIVQPFGSPNKTILHKLNSLTFTKTEPEEERADEEASTDYIMFQDGEEYTSGALFKLSNKINESSDGYDVKADVNQVSLYSSTAIIQEVTYKSKAYDLQKIDITSDSCGELKREPAKDEDDNVIPPENINLLTKSDESGSQHSIGSIDVISGSDEVELGTLDLQSLAVTDQHFMNGDFFVPRIAGTEAEINTIATGIQSSENIELLTDFKIDITQASEGDNCTSITITPSTKKETFTFHSGLLTKKTNDDSWQSQSPTSFVVGNCSSDECDDAELGDLFFTTITRYAGSSGNWTLYRIYNYSNPVLINHTAGYNNLTIKDAEGSIIFTGDRSSPSFVDAYVFNTKNANDDCELHVHTATHSSDIPQSSLLDGELIKTGEKIVFS